MPAFGQILRFAQNDSGLLLVILSNAKDLASLPIAARFFAPRAQNDKRIGLVRFLAVILNAVKDLAATPASARFFALRAQNDRNGVVW
jgi:hypothetical protein